MSRIMLTGLTMAVFSGLQLPSVFGGEDVNGESQALELFHQRIMPIFRSPEPSSCVQCHLASVDLKDYIRPSHEQTFVSLRDQGLIDLDEPEQSKILKLIQMGTKDPDKGARLIHEKTRKAEYEAFAAWITACCNDPKLRALPSVSGGKPAGPEKPDPVIRHTRKSRVLDSFVRNVWSQRMRCFPCHTPYELDETNPRHKKGLRRRRQYEEQYGTRINIFQETPAETMQRLIERSRSTPDGQLPLLNLETPRKSLLVKKPTSKLPPKDEEGHFQEPSNAEPVSHMGGLKMHVDDHSYKSFLAWIADYARVVGGEYSNVSELPADNWYPTQYVVRLNDAPEDWPAATRVQLFVHDWNDEDAAWDSVPIAFTQGTVTPRRMVFGALILLGPRNPGTGKAGDEKDAALSPGKYLVKAYVDAQKRLAENPTALLGEEQFYGQTEIQARWKQGFRNAELIPGKQLEK